MNIPGLRNLYAAYEQELLSRGLTSVVRYPGTYQWQALMERHQMNVNPAFKMSANPELTKATGLCLIGFVDNAPRAAVCGRVYPLVSDFPAFIASGKMWSAPFDVLGREDWEYCDPSIHPTGNLVQIGGLFIERGYCKGGGKFLARMARITALLGWANPGVDGIIGLLSDENFKRFPEGNAGCRPVGLIAKGLAIGCPPTDFHLTYAEPEAGLWLDGYKNSEFGYDPATVEPGQD